MEFINADDILVLERDFNDLTFRRVTTLTKVSLGKGKVCKSRVLAKLDSWKGWNIDNFEGLTKVSHNKFLMVSDDNGSFLQKTLLVLFEILDE